MKIVIITGATSGIGFSCVEKFLSNNYLVVGVGRNKKKLNDLKKKTKKNSNSKFLGINCDFSKKKDLNTFFKKVSKFKKIDSIINCAGVAFKTRFKNLHLNEWNKLMYINVTIPYLIIQKLIKNLRKSSNASVVNISSIAGKSGSVSLGCHYTTSKAALIGMTKHLAKELGSMGIRVNCCAPSQTKTPMLKKSLSAKNQKKLIKNIPLGRLSLPLEQAEVIYFLASKKSSYINGAVIDVNGGQL